MTSVFFILTVSPNLQAAQANRSKSCCAQSCECAIRAQSSAKSRSRTTDEKTLVRACSLRRLKTLPSVLNWIGTPRLQSLNATSSIIEKKMEKSSGASTHPCLVPLVTLKGAEVSPLSRTQPCIPSWKDCIMLMNFGGHPLFFRIFESPSLLTESKALVGSMKIV